MNDIEKRARELLAAEWESRGAWVEASFVRGPMYAGDPVLCAIIAALTIREGELLAGGSVNLLDQQNPGGIAAQVLDVVPAAALGADEAGAVGIGGQGDQSVGNVELAEVAPEHEVGVPAGSDSGMTASLAPPEGYVLVPVDPTLHMTRAAKTWGIGPNVACAIFQSMLAARPEVSP